MQTHRLFCNYLFKEQDKQVKILLHVLHVGLQSKGNYRNIPKHSKLGNSNYPKGHKQELVVLSKYLP